MPSQRAPRWRWLRATRAGRWQRLRSAPGSARRRAIRPAHCGESAPGPLGGRRARAWPWATGAAEEPAGGAAVAGGKPATAALSQCLAAARASAVAFPLVAQSLRPSCWGAGWSLHQESAGEAGCRPMVGADPVFRHDRGGRNIAGAPAQAAIRRWASSYDRPLPSAGVPFQVVGRSARNVCRHPSMRVAGSQPSPSLAVRRVPYRCVSGAARCATQIATSATTAGCLNIIIGVPPNTPGFCGLLSDSSPGFHWPRRCRNR